MWFFLKLISAYLYGIMRLGSTLVQVMACCCLPTSHYLNQCWFIVNCIKVNKLLVTNFKWNIFIVENAAEKCLQDDSHFVILQCVNSLWPRDAIWQHRSGPTLAQVMASCPTAPSHYLTQCWLCISEVLCLSSEGDFTKIGQDVYPWFQMENY